VGAEGALHFGRTCVFAAGRRGVDDAGPDVPGQVLDPLGDPLVGRCDERHPDAALDGMGHLLPQLVPQLRELGGRQDEPLGRLIEELADLELASRGGGAGAAAEDTAALLAITRVAA